MAASYNKVFLMGNLTRDPETRVTPAGMTIAKLGLAVNRKFKSKDGELKEEVTFVDIDAFGIQAETIQKYCTKGSGLFVEGRLRLDQWKDKESGENRTKLGVVLEGFQFVGGKGGDQEGGNGAPQQASQAPRRTPAAAPAAPLDDFSDDDVPF
jgi:single-strand DNA-binding protein